MFFSGIADEAGKSIETQTAAHREMGWNHIELRNVNDAGIALMDDEAFAVVADSIEAASLRVSCFASAIANWSRPITGDPSIDYGELRRAIPRMRRLHVPFVRVMSYPNAKEDPLPEREWRRESIRRLRELARIAENEGVTLLHENCSGWGAQSGEHHEILLGEVDSPALKTVFDTGNPVVYGNDGWDYYVRNRASIAYVHIKDARKVDDRIVYTFAGEGEGRVHEIVTDLLRTGYDGGFSMEPHIAAVVHTGAAAPSPEKLYASYIEYGRRFADLFAEIKASIE